MTQIAAVVLKEWWGSFSKKSKTYSPHCDKTYIFNIFYAILSHLIYKNNATFIAREFHVEWEANSLVHKKRLDSLKLLYIHFFDW